MTSRQRGRGHARKPRQRQHGRDRRLGRWIAAALLVTAAALVIVLTTRDWNAPASIGNRHDMVWAPNWPPLPSPRAAPALPLAEVRAAYAFAARRPDDLRYIPCYCGCEHHGHRSNRDCYIKRQAADGTPEWDDHSFT